MNYYFKRNDGKWGKGYTAKEAIEQAYGKEAYDALPAIYNSGWQYQAEKHADVSTLYQTEGNKPLGTILKDNFQGFSLRAFAI